MKLSIMYRTIVTTLDRAVNVQWSLSLEKAEWWSEYYRKRWSLTLGTYQIDRLTWRGWVNVKKGKR